MTQTALVLGGSVFVGRRLVEHLLTHDWEVTILNRGRTPVPFGPKVRRLFADRSHQSMMADALADTEWDAVFDVSGFVMAAGGSDIDLLLDLLDGRCNRFVYVSSIMAYAQGREVFPWTENDPTSLEGSATYGGFKAMVERMLMARWRTTGFPATVVRPAAIYGPWNNIYDMETPMFLRLLQRRPILLPHNGLVTGSYGHVDDLCRAMATLACRPEAVGEVFNVTAEAVSSLHYTKTLARVVGVEPDIVMLPEDPVGNPLPCGHLFLRRHHGALSVDKAKHLLGVEPRFDVESGHRDTFAWFVSQGWDRITTPLIDPTWRATWDFDREAQAAAEARR